MMQSGHFDKMHTSQTLPHLVNCFHALILINIGDHVLSPVFNDLEWLVVPQLYN